MGDMIARGLAKQVEGKVDGVTAQLADTGKKIEENKRAISYYWMPEPQPPARKDETGYFFDAFNLKSDEYIANHFEPLRLANTDYITRSSMGKDQSGTYDVWKYEFTPKNFKKTIIISSGLHGGEITLVAAMVRFLYYLVNEWEKYPELAKIREETKIIYVPFANPWGMSQFPRVRQNSNGVDLNRNFDYKHAKYTSSTQTPFGHDYKGTAPFSEVESRYIRDLVLSHPEAAAYIDLHNTGTTDRDYFVYLPESYPKKTYEKLSNYFTRKMNNPVINLDRNDSPTLCNYVYHILNIPASHPEWCDSRFGARQYDSIEVTKSLEWIANVIFEHCNEFGNINTAQTIQTLKNIVKERYYTYQSSNPINITNTTISTYFGEDIEVPFDGVVLFDGVVTVLNTSATISSRVNVTPKLGQTGSTPGYGTGNQNRWEVYADAPISSRVALPFQASMPVKKTELTNGKLGIGLNMSTATGGSYQLVRYRGRITFIPTDVTNFEVK